MGFLRLKRLLPFRSAISWKSLKIALAEVLLIVIGVLIAVYIDNWNTRRLKENQLTEIIEIIHNDFQEDEKSLKRIREHYEQRKPLFDSIINQSYTPNSIAVCKECHFLISGHLLFRPNIEGYLSLKRYLQDDDVDNQHLLSFVQDYSILLDELSLMKKNIVEDVNGNLTYWRDKYAWFTTFFQGKDNNDYYVYQATSPEYRNKVAYHYALVYENYLLVLQKFNDAQKRFGNN